MQCDKCNVTNVIWQLHCARYNETKAMRQMECDNHIVTDTMKEMQCDKYNVTNVMWQIQCDKCIKMPFHWIQLKIWYSPECSLNTKLIPVSVKQIISLKFQKPTKFSRKTWVSVSITSICLYLTQDCEKSIWQFSIFPLIKWVGDILLREQGNIRIGCSCCSPDTRDYNCNLFTRYKGLQL